MSVLVEDSPRNNLAAWTCDAIAAGSVEGAVLSPFTSPYVGNTYKQSARRTIERLVDAGGDVWLDSATHALQMPGVGDFRYYDGWDLWGGARGDLSSPAMIRDHVLRVLEAQGSLGVSRLAPSILLHGPDPAAYEVALTLASEAASADESARITIAGSPAFWSGGDELDNFVAAVADVGGAGYFLVVARPTADLPVSTSATEVAGLCRTARSLEQFGPVHVSHGDFAALPAVAAGAQSIGSGWDTRQRVCSYTSYEVRDPTSGGGGWFKRPTMAGLFAFLTRAEAERLSSQDRSLFERLHRGPIHPDGPKEAFLHHVSVLNEVSTAVADLDFGPAYSELLARYRAAVEDWPDAAAAAGTAALSALWVDPLLEGLVSYGEQEGWT